MSTYLITSKGFYKETIITPQIGGPPTKEHIFVPHVREAQPLSAKTAKRLLETLGEGFLWNPYAEEPLKGFFQVVDRSRYSFGDKAVGYTVEPAKMEKESDAQFIATKRLRRPDLMTEIEALDRALALNKGLALQCQVEDLTMQVRLNALKKENAA